MNINQIGSLISFVFAFWFLLSLLWVAFNIEERQKIILWCNFLILFLFSIFGVYLAFLGIN